MAPAGRGGGSPMVKRYRVNWRVGCKSYWQQKEDWMIRFLMNVVRFRMGQKAGKKVARSMGLRWISKPLGLLAGIKATR